MRFWNRVVLGALVLALSLSLNVVTANAATTAKKPVKKVEKKKEKKKEKKHEERREVSSGERKYIEGVNLAGRSGLFLGDTSEAVGVGRFIAGAHFTLQDGFLGSSVIGIPFGASFGVAKNLDLSAGANLSIISPGSTSVFAIDLGGKYHIATSKSGLDFSLGGDVLIPTNTGGQVAVTPRGTITYVLPSGLLLNGDLGIVITNPTTYVSVDVGAALPVGSKLNLIAEIGANQGGYLASQLALGARYKVSSNFNLQGLLGIPMNGGNVMAGVGLSISSL